jgi:hypothetical protein
MKNNNQKNEIEEMPLILSMTKIRKLKSIKLEKRKVINKKIYNEENYPINGHFKKIIRF